ncbi:hypothetical protein [Alistipes sp. ZOR0009]|uniref:hypothetical protein n=1 Tax=Alistipes sp. ZOR0009 TaxID=1339253 RepID=UPI000647EAF1|nr:hypothetical protein [Alistipes sp. ZOR0009]
MKNLLAEYHDIFEDSERWKYYDKLTIETNPFHMGCGHDNNENARRFIESYFGAANKDVTLLKMDRSNRQLHSVSSFFLGILIKEKLFPKLLEEGPGFLYLWFLTSLYHDMGYVVELNKEEYPPEETCLELLNQRLGCWLPIYSTYYDLLKEGESSSLYSVETIKKYYEYCRTSCINTVNHGIVGGLVLYHRLNENYVKCQELAEAYYKERGEVFNPDDFKYKGLHYDKNHKKYYSIAASTIMDHNIWLADKKSRNTYQENDLKELIRGPHACSPENQFLFLLALVDTIEPIKFFNQHTPDCLLGKISIEVDGNNGIVTLEIDNRCIAFEDWFKKIKSLERWFKVSVKDSNNIITIKLV